MLGLFATIRYLLHAAFVAAALEGSFEKLVHNGLGCLVVDEAAGEHEHVGVVVLADEFGYILAPSQSGTHTLMLVERDGHALTAATDGNTGIDFPALDGFGQWMGEVGIVYTLVTVGAEILDGVALLLSIV